MKALTKKQIYEFAKIYIGTQMFFIDTGCIGDIGDNLSGEDCEKIVLEINTQGKKILGNRETILSPEEILKHIQKL